MKALLVLPLLWIFLPAALSQRNRESFQRVSLMKEAHVPAISNQDVDNNFENGTIAPWTECSEDGSRWIIENYSSLTNEMIKSQQQQPPPPNNGNFFIWLKHELKIYGIGILSSPYFIAYPGDEITFSYWLCSPYRHFNNIEVLYLGSSKTQMKRTTRSMQEWLLLLFLN